MGRIEMNSDKLPPVGFEPTFDLKLLQHVMVFAASFSHFELLGHGWQTG